MGTVQRNDALYKNTNCFRKIPNQLVCPTYDARRYGNCASGKNDADGRFYPWGFCRSDVADVDGFKMGVEKGRAAYYVMIGFVCGVSVLISGFLKGQPAAEIKPNWVLEILAVIGIGTYLFSWYMSVVFYKKREIQ